MSESRSAPESRVLKQVHDLKCWAPFYAAVASGAKTFEVRRNDRGYNVGDVLHLREWTGTRYSGRTCLRAVTYTLESRDGTDAALFGVKPGFVVMALATEDAQRPTPESDFSGRLGDDE